jgi:hypothetical protein
VMSWAFVSQTLQGLQVQKTRGRTWPGVGASLDIPPMKSLKIYFG